MIVEVPLDDALSGISEMPPSQFLVYIFCEVRGTVGRTMFEVSSAFTSHFLVNNSTHTQK